MRSETLIRAMRATLLRDTCLVFERGDLISDSTAARMVQAGGLVGRLGGGRLSWKLSSRRKPGLYLMDPKTELRWATPPE